MKFQKKIHANMTHLINSCINVSRRAGIERELASRADQRVLRCLGIWKEWMSTVWPEGC